jgi:hypothetical protein
MYAFNKEQSTNQNQMRIKQAIKELQELEKHGVKNIILAFWEADGFEKEDDESWAEDVEIVEDSFDWSATHEDLTNFIETLSK